MAHCRNDTFEEKTRCVSSQVVGDNTAHTVTIRSMGFMPEILRAIRRNDNTNSYGTGRTKFHYPVKRRGSGNARLKTDTKDQPSLVTLEIDEIEGHIRSGWTPPRLNAPACGQPRAL